MKIFFPIPIEREFLCDVINFPELAVTIEDVIASNDSPVTDIDLDRLSRIYQHDSLHSQKT